MTVSSDSPTARQTTHTVTYDLHGNPDNWLQADEMLTLWSIDDHINDPVGPGSKRISGRSALRKEYSPAPSPVLPGCLSQQYWLSLTTPLCWEVKITSQSMDLKIYMTYITELCVCTLISYPQHHSRRCRLFTHLCSKGWTNSPLVSFRKNMLESLISEKIYY